MIIIDYQRVYATEWTVCWTEVSLRPLYGTLGQKKSPVSPHQPVGVYTTSRPYYYYSLTVAAGDVWLYTGRTPLKLMPCQEGNQRQKWKRDLTDGYIRSGLNGNKVLDIYGQSFTQSDCISYEN